MHRQPLRSRTGCLRCRQRRVKCGEEKPTCIRCARWNFECLWPDQTHEERPERGATTYFHLNEGKLSPLLSYQNDFLTIGYQNFRNETQHQLVKSAIAFVGKFATYGGNDAAMDQNFCMNLVSIAPWIRDALSAFTATTMSRWDSRFTRSALKSHHAAMIHLRLQLSSQPAAEDEIYIITAILFLGLLEYFGKANPMAAFVHLSVVARRALILGRLPPSDLSQLQNRWTIAMVTLSLDLCGNIFMFEPRIYTIFENEWDKLDAFFLNHAQPLADQNCGLREGNMRTMIQLRINRLIYRDASASNAEDVLRHIDTLEAYVSSPRFAVLHEQHLTNLIAGWFAETSMLKLHVAVIADRSKCSGDEQIRSLVTEWKKQVTIHLQTRTQSMPHSTWLLPFTRLRMDNHLAVVGFYVTLFCVMHDLTSFEEMVNVYSQMEFVIDPKLTQSVSSLINTIRHRKRTISCELEEKGFCQNRHDGLDALRNPDGILFGY